MNVAGLLNREVALADSAMSFGSETHLVFECDRREYLFDRVFRIFYQRWIYTVTFENDEPDVPHC